MLNNILTAAILHSNEEVVVPDGGKAIFYAAAELEVRCISLKPETYTNSRIMVYGEPVSLVLHPVLSEDLLKLDITNQPEERDYDLPREEITSPASYPSYTH